MAAVHFARPRQPVRWGSRVVRRACAEDSVGARASPTAHLCHFRHGNVAARGRVRHGVGRGVPQILRALICNVVALLRRRRVLRVFHNLATGSNRVEQGTKGPGGGQRHGGKGSGNDKKNHAGRMVRARHEMLGQAPTALGILSHLRHLGYGHVTAGRRVRDCIGCCVPVVLRTLVGNVVASLCRLWRRLWRRFWLWLRLGRRSWLWLGPLRLHHWVGLYRWHRLLYLTMAIAIVKGGGSIKIGVAQGKGGRRREQRGPSTTICCQHWSVSRCFQFLCAVPLLWSAAARSPAPWHVQTSTVGRDGERTGVSQNKCKNPSRSAQRAGATQGDAHTPGAKRRRSVSRPQLTDGPVALRRLK